MLADEREVFQIIRIGAFKKHGLEQPVLSANLPQFVSQKCISAVKDRAGRVLDKVADSRHGMIHPDRRA
jgi:hypothetical protein